MYRSHWELAALVPQRNAYLIEERRVCSLIDRTIGGRASLVTQLQHRLGVGLIRVGHTIAGYDALRGLPTPPARPATWSPGS